MPSRSSSASTASSSRVPRPATAELVGDEQGLELGDHVRHPPRIAQVGAALHHPDEGVAGELVAAAGEQQEGARIGEPLAIGGRAHTPRGLVVGEGSALRPDAGVVVMQLQPQLPQRIDVVDASAVDRDRARLGRAHLSESNTRRRSARAGPRRGGPPRRPRPIDPPRSRPRRLPAAARSASARSRSRTAPGLSIARIPSRSSRREEAAARAGSPAAPARAAVRSANPPSPSVGSSSSPPATVAAVTADQQRQPPPLVGDREEPLGEHVHEHEHDHVGGDQGDRGADEPVRAGSGSG